MAVAMRRYRSSKKSTSEYRGYKWNSLVDLSRQLHMSEAYVCIMLKRKPDWTIEDIIDYVLEEDRAAFRRKKNMGNYKEYKGYKWKTRAELSVLLGKYKQYVARMLKIHPDWVEEDVIDYCESIKVS